MGTSNGLDDYNVDAICEYAESYGYIHEDDIEKMIQVLNDRGFFVINVKEVLFVSDL